MTLAALLLLALAPTTVLAGAASAPDYGTWNPTGLPLPPEMEAWGLEKATPRSNAPGGEVHIVTDPLVSLDSAVGWVTFWCQSTVGFQYNIGATGLDPLLKYSVHAFGIQATFADSTTPGATYIPSEGIWIVIVGPVELHLGTFKTDAQGLGGAKGVARLAAGYLYEVSTVISNDDGTVLWSPPDDGNGFIVY